MAKGWLPAALILTIGLMGCGRTPYTVLQTVQPTLSKTLIVTVSSQNWAPLSVRLSDDLLARYQNFVLRRNALDRLHRGAWVQVIHDKLADMTLKQIEALEATWSQEPGKLIDFLDSTLTAASTLTEQQLRALVAEAQALPTNFGVSLDLHTLT